MAKRAPGGGRKPNGPIARKTANFSTRISQPTRDQLVRVARAEGMSMSQMAEVILREGLAERDYVLK